MDESDQIKEVYAHYGLAMYVAQCVEQSLIQMLIFHDFFPKNIQEKTYLDSKKWVEEFDKFDDIVSSKTMGRVLGLVRGLDILSEQETEKLKVALKKRNWLAHSYFSERAQHFMLPEGMKEMISELEECRDFLGEIDKTLMKSIYGMCEKYGITEKDFEDIKNKMINEVKSSF